MNKINLTGIDYYHTNIKRDLIIAFISTFRLYMACFKYWTKLLCIPTVHLQFNFEQPQVILMEFQYRTV